MTEPVALKYRAFISYSHADTAQAKWLHRGLESCRIDGDLAGRETKSGPIPKTIKPIFRDRDDFTAGHTLTEQTLAALDASSALIVLCSPAAAKSHYVNEEIRLFKQRHPKRSVVPLIVDGKPADPERECFPPALKFKVDAKGRIGKKPLELLAADAREEGDGKALALAKVIAGLLDVTSDEVFRRSERERRRKARVRNGVIGVLAFLSAAAIGSAAYAWQQLKTNEAFLYATLKTATSFVDDAVTQAEKYGVPRTATLSLLTRAEGLFDNMAMLGKPTPELRYQKAWMLIQFARNYQALGDTTKWQERAVAAQQLLQTLSDGDPPRAMPAGSAISPWPTTSWVTLIRRKVSPTMHLSPTSRAVRSWNASPRRTRAILAGSAKSRSPTLRLGMWCSPKGTPTRRSNHSARRLPSAKAWPSRIPITPTGSVTSLSPMAAWGSLWRNEGRWMTRSPSCARGGRLSPS